MPACAPMPAASPPEPQRASSSLNTAPRTASIPNQPRSAIQPNTSFGNHRAASHSSTRGHSSARTHARSSARNASDCSVNGGIGFKSLSQHRGAPREYGQMQRLGHETDEWLLSSDDPAEFARLYDRYVESMLAYFQRRTRDAEAAADLTAETFAAALVARRRFRPGGAPAAAWLFGIAQHKLTDYHRRGFAEDRMRRRLGMERLPVSAEDADLIRFLGEDVASKIVNELPPDQRDAVRAHVLDEREYGEIAQTEHLSEATVRQRVSRGLRTLRERSGRPG
jgi:RNA polymerase sigma factor (sigma-70 family)